MRAAEAKKEENYMNYRSNFLLLWLGVNLAVGGAITQLSRDGQNKIIFFPLSNYMIILYLGLALSVVLAIKIIFAFVHVAVSCLHV